MFRWFLIATFICTAASDQEFFLTFDPNITILAECVKHELVPIDEQYNSTEVSKEISYLAARRFHKKSMESENFILRLKHFFFHLRSNKIRHKISEDKLSERLRLLLKRALIICADKSPLPPILLKLKNEKNELISFSSNKFWLTECIKSHLRLTGQREFHLNHGFTELIAQLAAKRFSGKSLSKSTFYRSNECFINSLRREKRFHNITDDKMSRELKFTVRQAVEDCAMDKEPLMAVPVFENEPLEIARVLDLILVRWPEDVHDMIQSRYGRATLRRYANDALTALMSELGVYQNDTQIFRLALRSFWYNRAREMYNANSVELPYILHSYTSNYPTPHMFKSDFEKFVNRSSTDFNERNPYVSKSRIQKILNIHTPDRPSSNGSVDIYDSYNNCMTSAEYYFENQINQFYRVLLFFMELRARGILTNEHDVYNKTLFHHLVPKKIQAIIYDDNVYRDYLLRERLFYERLISNDNDKNEIAQNLFENSRVLEENLIMLKSNGVQSGNIRVITETTITKTQSLKRKDDVCKNEYGKCFPKRAKTITGFYSGISNGNSSMEDFDESEATNSTLPQNSDYSETHFSGEDSSMYFVDELGASHNQDEFETNKPFGYMISDDHPKRLQLVHDKFSVFQNQSCLSDVDQIF